MNSLFIKIKVKDSHINANRYIQISRISNISVSLANKMHTVLFSDFNCRNYIVIEEEINSFIERLQKITGQMGINEPI